MAKLDNEGAQLLLFVAGIIGYLIVFVYYLTYGDIAFSERIFFFIASFCYGWLAWESVQAKQDMLISAVMTGPMIGAGVVLADIRAHGVIIASLPLTGIYVAVALLCGITALWVRATGKKNSGRDASDIGQSAASGSASGTTGGYDPYGPHAGYDPYGPSAGGYSTGYHPGASGAKAESDWRGPGFGNANGYSGYGTWERYEPGSQYRKDGDERYAHGGFGQASDSAGDSGFSGFGDCANAGGFSDASVFAALTYDDTLLRAVMVSLGFMLNNSSSSAELQQIFMDETMERLRVPEGSMDKARGFADEGRHSSMWNVGLCMQEAKLDARDPNLAAALFFSIAGSLFYDEQVTADEVQIFNRMAQAFQVAPALAERIFRQLLKDYNLFYDANSGKYTAYGYSKAGAGFGGSAGSEGDGYRRQEEREQKREEKKEPTYTSKELRNAYITLQIKKDATDAEVKAAYRKLIARYHPDKAIARGLSESEVANYNEITQKLNQAYDIIRMERDL
ncbi:MAG: DnaJ domain-containing protein [Succinivibrionaceae bacterium]|nr:DnaJ domain-containing protein [Succinivibrionaceae bacterium]